MALTKVTGQVIKNTTDVTVGVLTVTNTLAVGGTVSIGGTLTYEDVTNVDAVGLITARNGIVVGSGITLSKDGDGFFTGVITATSYSGIDLSDVTGATGDFSIADKIVHTGDTDTAIRFPSANTVSVEAAGVQKLSLSTSEVVFNDTGIDCDFRIEGDSNANLVKVDAGNDRVGVGLAAPQQVFHVYHASDNGLALFESGDANCRIDLKDNSGQASVEAIGDALRFGTSSSNTERMRITSSGRVNIGDRTTSPDELVHIHTSSGEANVHVEAATNANLNLRSHSGDSTIKFSDASASNVGNINYDHATDSLSFRTNSSERARIDSSGRFGLGTNNPDTLLHLNASSGSTLQRFQSSSYSSYIAQIQADDNVSNGSLAGELALRGQSGISMSANNGTATHFRIASDGDVTITPSGDPRLILIGSGHPQLTLTTTSGSDHCGVNFGDSDDNNAGMIQYTNSSDYMVFHTGGTERMRIHNGLYTTFGTTSTYPRNGGISVEGGVGHIVLSRSGTGSEVMVRFERSNSTRGDITVSTSTTYNTTSDYRLKENVTDLSDAITRLKKITPRRFSFIDDENKQLVDGFIAHEVSEAVPEAVKGTKDQVATADDVAANKATTVGEPIHQQVDYSKYVPLLTAALQEAVARIEALEG